MLSGSGPRNSGPVDERPGFHVVAAKRFANPPAPRQVVAVIPIVPAHRDDGERAVVEQRPDAPRVSDNARRNDPAARFIQYGVQHHGIPTGIYGQVHPDVAAVELRMSSRRNIGHEVGHRLELGFLDCCIGGGPVLVLRPDHGPLDSPAVFRKHVFFSCRVALQHHRSRQSCRVNVSLAWHLGLWGHLGPRRNRAAAAPERGHHERRQDCRSHPFHIVSALPAYSEMFMSPQQFLIHPPERRRSVEPTGQRSNVHRHRNATGHQGIVQDCEQRAGHGSSTWTQPQHRAHSRCGHDLLQCA